MREDAAPGHGSGASSSARGRSARAVRQRLPDPVGEGLVQLVDQLVDVHQYMFDSFHGDSDTLNRSSTTMARHCNICVALRPANWLPTQFRMRSLSFCRIAAASVGSSSTCRGSKLYSAEHSLELVEVLLAREERLIERAKLRMRVERYLSCHGVILQVLRRRDGGRRLDAAPQEHASC